MEEPVTEPKAERDPVARAFAFSAGGFDAVMQLGVAHGLLVTRAAAPDYIVGVSSGAVNATALVEVLQAGKHSDNDRTALQFDRLREYINAAHELRSALADAILPDSLEVFATRPLKPLESPLHFEDERSTRSAANESKAGLIDAINAIFGIRLSVSAATIIVRRILGIIESAEKPTRWMRMSTEVLQAGGLIMALWRYLAPVADLFGALVWAAICADTFSGIRKWKANHLSSAAELLPKFRVWRRLGRLIRSTGKILFTTALLASLTIVWAMVWVPLGVPLGQLRRGKRLHGASGSSRLWDRVLAYFNLRTGLADTDALKQQIIHCFDRKYYGEVEVETAICRALDYDPEPAPTTHFQRRRIGDYEHREPSIGLGVVAADIAGGRLEVLPPQIPIVDALTAATALVPFFPAVAIDAHKEAERAHDAGKEWESTEQKKTWFIDGSNISKQAIGPLMGFLRGNLKKLEENGKRRIDVYPVSTLPISKGELPRSKDGRGVLAVALRAMQLQHLRDASLERRLTTLYSRAIGDSMSKTVDGRTFIAANIYPIDLDDSPGLNVLALTSSDEEKLRGRTHETIANGCRATSEVVMHTVLMEVAKSIASGEALTGDDSAIVNAGGAVVCRLALRRRFKGGAELPRDLAENVPGIDDICKSCSLFVRHDDPDCKTELKKIADQLITRFNQAEQRHDPVPPEWPVREQISSEEPVSYIPPYDSRETAPEEFQPMRSLLFGGGVFRGVCQVGVLNALNELHLQPDIVAGSSVGAIMAAMIARVFCAPRDERPLRIGRLAATFLAIDRLVLTDRLADFVRRITLRAGHTTFSPLDLDRAFRRFDMDGTSTFGLNLRKIAAGIERLFYISPFELGRLVQLLREGRDEAGTELLEDIGDFLRRGGVGDEILGAEPLRLLLELHVFDNILGDVRDVSLDHFPDLTFFATTTDMHAGKLVLLKSDDATSKPSLLFSLLASSAFPVVFRPRSSWEVFRRAGTSTKYLDGGIIDNLPLDAVAQYLDESMTHPIQRRPAAAPHLLFTASLEVDKEIWKPQGWDVNEARRSWRLLSGRARTFTYNRKIDTYTRFQRDVRKLVGDPKERPGDQCLLDLEVVAVKPKWLCSTFGFHPMLGFKRWKQAASIAHGCASTFGTMVAHHKANDQHLNAWRIDLKDIDEQAITTESASGGDPILQPRGEGKKPGTCWFRNTTACPFSFQGTESVPWSEQHRDKFRSELQQIYAACGLARNHLGARP